MICKKCGNEIGEGQFAFCPHCGDQIEKPGQTEQSEEIIYCTECGAQTTSAFKFCADCGNPLAHDTNSDQSPRNTYDVDSAQSNVTQSNGMTSNGTSELGKNLQQPKTAAQKTETAGKSKKKILICGIGIGVLVAAIAAILILNPFSWGAKDGTLFYVKDNSLMSLELPSIKALKVTDEFFAEDSKLNPTAFDLYFAADTSAIGSDQKKVFYLKDISNGNFKYLYRYLTGDDTREHTIFEESNDMWTYYINTDKTHVFYLDASNTLYQANLQDEFGSSQVVDTGISRIVYDSDDDSKSYYGLAFFEDTGIIYYVKDNILYKKEVDKDKMKIAADVHSLASIDSQGVYYLKTKQRSKAMWDYVEDDMALNLPKEPQIPDFLVEVRNDAQRLGYDPLIHNFFNFPDDDGYDYDYDYYLTHGEYFWDRYPQAYYDEYLKYTNDYYKNYWQPNYIYEHLVSFLKENSIEESGSDLYYTDGTNETKVSEDVLETFMMWYGLSAYTKYDDAAVRAKLTEIHKAMRSSYDVNFDQLSLYYPIIPDEGGLIGWYLRKNDLSDILYDTMQKAKTTCLASVGIESKLGKVEFTDLQSNPEGNTLYYIDKSNARSLMKIEVKNNTALPPIKVTDNVGNYYPWHDGQLIYFKDSSGNKASLYLNDTHIADNVFFTNYSYLPESNKLCDNVYISYDHKKMMFLTEYDNAKQTGVLMQWENGKMKQIAENVHSFCAGKGKSVAYITNYNVDTKKGDAMLYKGSEKHELIDIGVDKLLIVNYKQ